MIDCKLMLINLTNPIGYKLNSLISLINFMIDILPLFNFSKVKLLSTHLKAIEKVTVKVYLSFLYFSNFTVYS